MKQHSSLRSVSGYLRVLLTAALCALAGVPGWGQEAVFPAREPGLPPIDGEPGVAPTHSREEAIALRRGAATLEGSVATDAGFVVSSGVIVGLESLDGERMDEQSATSTGSFRFTGLPRGAYRLTVSARGFQTFQGVVAVNYRTGTAHVDVRLEAKEGKNLVSEKLPALSDRGASRKVRKEYEKGVRSLQNGEWREAQRHLAKAVEMYPCYARAQAQLGSALAAQDQQLPAEVALRKAISCDHDFVLSYAVLGRLYNAEKRFADSETVLKEGVRRAPSAWQFYYHLAEAHFGLGQYTKAEEEFLKVRSLDPAPPASLHVKLATVYHKEAANDKAYAELQAYLRAAPDGPLATKVREEMKRMEAASATLPTQANATHSPPAKP
jgi:Tfp pilus assembly protein PilF